MPSAPQVHGSVNQQQHVMGSTAELNGVSAAHDIAVVRAKTSAVLPAAPRITLTMAITWGSLAVISSSSRHRAPPLASQPTADMTRFATEQET